MMASSYVSNGRIPDKVTVIISLSTDSEQTLQWALNKCQPGDSLTVLHIVDSKKCPLAPSETIHKVKNLTKAAHSQCTLSDQLNAYKEQVGRAYCSLLYPFKQVCECKGIEASVRVAHGVDVKRVTLRELELLGTTKLVIGELLSQAVRTGSNLGLGSGSGSVSRGKLMQYLVEKLPPHCFLYDIKGGRLVGVKAGTAKNGKLPWGTAHAYLDNNNNHCLPNSASTSASQSPATTLSPATACVAPPNLNLTIEVPQPALPHTLLQHSPAPATAVHPDSMVLHCSLPSPRSVLPSAAVTMAGPSTNSKVAEASEGGGHTSTTSSTSSSLSGSESNSPTQDIRHLHRQRLHSHSHSLNQFAHSAGAVDTLGSSSRQQQAGARVAGVAGGMPTAGVGSSKSGPIEYTGLVSPRSGGETVGGGSASPRLSLSRFLALPLSPRNKQAAVAAMSSGGGAAASCGSRSSGMMSPRWAAALTAVGWKSHSSSSNNLPKSSSEHMAAPPTTATTRDSHACRPKDGQWQGEAVSGCCTGTGTGTGCGRWEGLAMPVPTLSYSQLSAATRGFSPELCIGEGGFSKVYHGTLPDGMQVAVKSVTVTGGSSEDASEWSTEASLLSAVRHAHIVPLLGCVHHCSSNDNGNCQMLLVYPLMARGTLEQNLHGSSSSSNRVAISGERDGLGWRARCVIARQVAQAVEYLHFGCHERLALLHRDLKASNVMLSHSGDAKISDFGLATWWNRLETNPISNNPLNPNPNLISSSSSPLHAAAAASSSQAEVVGTFGYLAPESVSCGDISDKSDVYSYGVLLLELLTGKRPLPVVESGKKKSLVEWAKPRMEKGSTEELLDPVLRKKGISEEEEEEWVGMMQVAYHCLCNSPAGRPSMKQVVRLLESCTHDASCTFAALEPKKKCVWDEGSKPCHSGSANSGAASASRGLLRSCSARPVRGGGGVGKDLKDFYPHHNRSSSEVRRQFTALVMSGLEEVGKEVKRSSSDSNSTLDHLKDDATSNLNAPCAESIVPPLDKYEFSEKENVTALVNSQITSRNSLMTESKFPSSGIWSSLV